MRQSNTRIFGVLVAIAMLAVMVCAGALPARAGAATRGRPGTLDPSFGHDGETRARSIAEHASSEFGAAAAAPDGDLFLELKRQLVGEGEAREIEARTPTGSLDPSFASEGRLTVGRGTGLVALPDGDLAIGVETCDGKKGSVVMVDPRGTRVATFGDDGCGAPSVGGDQGVALDGQGRILVLGKASYCPCYHDVTPSEEAVVTRLLPDGHRDSTFGKGGAVGTHEDAHVEVGGYPEGADEPVWLATAPDGDILISKGGTVIALDESGALDRAYGEGGVAVIAGRTGQLTVQSDGSAFVLSAETEPTITKLTPSGTPDPTFGKDGVVQPSFSSVSYFEYDPIAPAPGGGVYVGAAIAEEACVRPCAAIPTLTRLDATGQPDPSYGDAGVASVAVPSAPMSSPPSLEALAVAADGTTFAAGSGEGENAFVAAFAPGGAPLSSFAEDGGAIERYQRQVLLESTGLLQRPDGGFTLAADQSNGPGLPGAFLLGFDAAGKQQRFADGAFATGTLAHGIVVPDGAGRAVAWGGERRNRVLRAAGPVGELLDKRYGKDGLARFPEGLYPEEVVPAPGGGAAVIGTLDQAMAVFRIGPRGRPVPGFGHRGLATASFPGAKALGLAGLVAPDGDVVLTGSVGDFTGVARLLPSGRLDPSFGHGGRVGPLVGRDTYGQLIAPSRGGVVIAVDREGTRLHTAGLLRLDADGRVDRSFGHRGLARGGAERAPLALLAGAGHVVTVTDPTYERGHRGEGVELRAWGADGSVDRRFGHEGVAFFGVDTGTRKFNPDAAIQQPDGKIVVAGTFRGKSAGGGFSAPRTKAALVRFLLR